MPDNAAPLTSEKGQGSASMSFGEALEVLAEHMLFLRTLLRHVDALTAENARLRGLGECICPKCGLRHGGRADGEPEF